MKPVVIQLVNGEFIELQLNDAARGDLAEWFRTAPSHGVKVLRVDSRYEHVQKQHIIRIGLPAD